ncbi:hypothetical protein Sjap_000713 [Stephania japonica]|uniref:Carbohydrate kinase PfkB domain-containing protein n=1 Tax=Stephania japonica TaxID=461633 RepID=A0AAP0PQS3_9MAGN
MGAINNSLPITPSNPPKSLQTKLINLKYPSPSPSSQSKPKPQFPTLTVNSSNPQQTTPIIHTHTHTPTPPLVVWGSANADIYVEIDRLPRPGETVSAKTGQTLSGGKGANQAVCAGRLEYPAVYFVGRVGEDANGRLIGEALEGGGVRVEYLKGGGGVPTGHAVVMLQSDGQNSIIIVGGANMEGWGKVLEEGELEVVRNAGIVLLQREIPDYVNIQVAKGVKEVLVKLGSKGSALFESFDDGFPNLFINNAQDIRGQHVAFLASFSSPSVIFKQLSIMFALPRLFVASFTLVLPFFPTGSFERMEEEGDVATAFTMARILSNVPISRGGPTSLVIYDIHALQERFYFGDHVLPCFETGIPLLKRRLHQLPDAENISIAFPDDGAWKRFYKQLQHFRML